MALPGRSARRGGAGFRWIAAGVVITLLVLLIDASVNSRSPAPQQTLAAGAWVDRVLPAITASTAEGQVLASVWSNGLKMPASELAGQISQVSAQSAQQYKTVADLRTPVGLGGPAGLLEAALLARSQAAAQLQKAFSGVLGAAANPPGTTTTTSSTSTTSTTVASSSRTTAAGSSSTTVTTVAPLDTTTAVSEITAAGADIQVGDSAYQLFLSSVPASLGIKFPPSAWGSDATPYGAQAAQVYLAALSSAAVTTPVYQVRILGIRTNPAPVSSSNGTEVLPDATAITLTIVVADTGNQPASRLTVTASISPASAGSSSVRDFVDLTVGQAYTIQGLGPLNPPQGVPVTLTVAIAGGAGSQVPPVTQLVHFQMPAPPPPSTTTTTTAAKTSTT
jgi:hypothetical protein